MCFQTMIQLMRTLLNQQMHKGRLTQNQYKDLMNDAQENMQNIVKQVQNEKEEEQEVNTGLTHSQSGQRHSLG